MNKKNMNPWVIMAFAVPASGIYVARLILTGQSLIWAAVGYVATGLAFGLIQSLFQVRQRMRVAFLSTALVPILAYLFLAGLIILAGMGILLYGEIPIGYGTEILSIPQRIGWLLGTVVLALVLSVLVIPFGLIGIAGRLLGDKLLPRLSRRLLPNASREWSSTQIDYLTQLNQALVNSFNIEEIRTLCFETGIDYEDISGEGKSGKVRELVIAVGNRDLVSEFDTLVRQNRPNIALKEPPQPWRQDQSIPEDFAVEMDRVEQANYRLATYLILSLAGLLIIFSILIAVIIE